MADTEVSTIETTTDTASGATTRQARSRRRYPVRRPFSRRRKVCAFCVDHIDQVDYKDIELLRRFISERGKILARRRTGTCAKHQRRLARAIKRARHMALLPFTGDHVRLYGG